MNSGTVNKCCPEWYEGPVADMLY